MFASVSARPFWTHTSHRRKPAHFIVKQTDVCLVYNVGFAVVTAGGCRTQLEEEEKILFRGALGSAADFVSGLHHRSLAYKPDIWRRRKDIASQDLRPCVCFCVGLQPPFVGMQARHLEEEERYSLHPGIRTLFYSCRSAPLFPGAVLSPTILSQRRGLRAPRHHASRARRRQSAGNALPNNPL